MDATRESHAGLCDSVTGPSVTERPSNKESLYQARMARYRTAMNNEMPDRVPVRPFVAEFTGQYAGYNCQELIHDYENAFAAARKCAADFDWDAIVPNMLATWSGMTQAMGLRYYLAPGIHLPVTMGHQYHEPPPVQAWMKPDEYDALIEDPTGFLYNVWLPRVSAPLSPIGKPVTYEHNVSLVKVWESIDTMGAMYVWWIALAF